MHKCKRMIVGCIDFRFQKEMTRLAQSLEVEEKNDRVMIAGAVKDKDFLLSQIEISKRLHDIEEVVLVIHEDCGAYSGDTEQQNDDLAFMEREIKTRWSEMTVRKYWMKLGGGWSELN